MKPDVSKLRVKIFADGADRAGMVEMARKLTKREAAGNLLESIWISIQRMPNQGIEPNRERHPRQHGESGAYYSNPAPGSQFQCDLGKTRVKRVFVIHAN